MKLFILTAIGILLGGLIMRLLAIDNARYQKRVAKEQELSHKTPNSEIEETFNA